MTSGRISKFLATPLKPMSFVGQLRDVGGDGGAVAGDECRFHLAFFLKGKGQPFDLLALHVTCELVSISVPPRKQIFLPARSFGEAIPMVLFTKKALVVIEDGPRKAKARVGGIDEIGRSGGEERDLAGL